MRSIINGLRYDTATAMFLAHLPSGSDSHSDFKYEDTAIYRTVGGRYFLAGSGGPMSRWARETGQGGWSGGSGIQALTKAEARDHLETCGDEGIASLETYFKIEEA